jgi:hypothetical protein
VPGTLGVDSEVRTAAPNHPKSGRAASEEGRSRPLFERAAREFGRLRTDGEVARSLDAPLLRARDSGPLADARGSVSGSDAVDSHG